jgi:transcriptional regulator with XRE-family HTH domain
VLDLQTKYEKIKMDLENTENLSVKERLIIFINSKNLSQSKFEKITNLSNGYVNNIRNSISDKIFDNRIHPAFPELNKIWVLHGKGSMVIEENGSLSSNKKEAPYKELPIDSKLNLLYDLVISQNKKIDNLARENAELKEQNEDIKERIKDNLFVLQSEIEAIMDEFNVQLDDKIKKDINKIVEQN